MVDECIPNQLFYGELSERKYSWCKAKKKFPDGMKTTMKSLGMGLEDIENLAADRAG